MLKVQLPCLRLRTSFYAWLEQDKVSQNQSWFYQMIVFITVKSRPLLWILKPRNLLQPKTVGNPALIPTPNSPASGKLHCEQAKLTVYPWATRVSIVVQGQVTVSPPGPTLLYWQTFRTKLSPNAWLFDMDMKGILLEEEGRWIPEEQREGREKKSLLHNPHLP